MPKSTQKPEFLPVNVLYFAWLRDYGKCNRPRAYRETMVTNPKTKKKELRVYTKTSMDMVDFTIYVNLLTRADKFTLTCFPSINLIGADCFGLERHTVINHLSDLEQMGFIETKKQKGKANTYYMKDFAEWLKNPRCGEEAVRLDYTTLPSTSAVDYTAPV